jgi:hypothetical protein
MGALFHWAITISYGSFSRGRDGEKEDGPQQLWTATIQLWAAIIK